MVGLIREKDQGGRPTLEATEGVKGNILEIIRENIVCYPAQISRLYGHRHRDGKPLSWSVVKQYLNQLKAEGKIVETVLHKGEKRTTTQVKVSEQHGQDL
jgi:hypothetical protein